METGIYLGLVAVVAVALVARGCYVGNTVIAADGLWALLGGLDLFFVYDLVHVGKVKLAIITGIGMTLLVVGGIALRGFLIQQTRAFSSPAAAGFSRREGRPARSAAGTGGKTLWTRLFGNVMGGGDAPAHAGGKSQTLTTRFLHMTIAVDTGIAEGRIRRGLHQGCVLNELSLDELRQLHRHYRRNDERSAQVLAAWLDRVHGEDWRDGTPKRTAAAHAWTIVSRDQALMILGLPDSAKSEDVRDAHRRLMRGVHPDRGGSTFLAAKINEARDLLLAE